MTEPKIQSWLDQGRGLGEGETYRPWFQVSDIPSHGKVTRVCGEEKFGIRNIHLLSTNEWRAYLRLAFDGDCTAFYEQLPYRDRLLTLGIASRLGLKHPENGYLRIPLVITTDVLATFRKESSEHKVGFAIKTAEDAAKERTQELLAIEEAACRATGADWRLLLDTELKNQFTENLERIYGYDRHLEITAANIDLILTGLLKYPNVTAHNICGECDLISGSAPGRSLALLKTFLWKKMIITDLSSAAFENILGRDFIPTGRFASRAAVLARYVRSVETLSLRKHDTFDFLVAAKNRRIVRVR
jgi:hypothetical protein